MTVKFEKMWIINLKLGMRNKKKGPYIIKLIANAQNIRVKKNGPKYHLVMFDNLRFQGLKITAKR